MRWEKKETMEVKVLKVIQVKQVQLDGTEELANVASRRERNDWERTHNTDYY